MATVTQIGPRLGIAPTCAALGLPRATYYRRRRPPRARAAAAAGRLGRSARRNARPCSSSLHAPRFVDLAPGGGLRHPARRGPVPLLRADDVSPPGRARRGAGAARTSSGIPCYAAPELLARRPNELWSWDITKLLGPGEVDLLLPVRHARRLQPVRGRLDGRPSRERRRSPSSSSARRVRARASAASSSPSTPTAARR